VSLLRLVLVYELRDNVTTNDIEQYFSSNITEKIVARMTFD